MQLERSLFLKRKRVSIYFRFRFRLRHFVRKETMNSLVDPIFFGFFGGSNVGKTTLLLRLADLGLCDKYQPTNGVNIVSFSLGLRDNLNLLIKCVDFGSELLHFCDQNVSSFDKNIASIFSQLHCAFFVIDVTEKQSILECNRRIELIMKFRKNNLSQLFTYILAHKADLPVAERVISPKNLDRWAINTESLDWSYTVGHRDLLDVDFSRGSASKQNPIEDIVLQIIFLILQGRDPKYHRLVSAGTSLRYIQWRFFRKEELGPSILQSYS